MPTGGDLLTSLNDIPINYDTIGNPTDDGTWYYAWQHGRQLDAMVSGTSVWDYSYDASGMRTSRTARHLLENTPTKQAPFSITA